MGVMDAARARLEKGECDLLLALRKLGGTWKLFTARPPDHGVSRPLSTSRTFRARASRVKGF